MVKSQKLSMCVCRKWERGARIYMQQWNSSGEDFECYTKTMQQQRAWSRQCSSGSGKRTLGDTKMSSTGKLWNQTCSPRVLPDPRKVLGTTGMVGWEKRGKQVHSSMDDICYTMFQVPMETAMKTPTPFLVPPTRAAHTHHARAAW